MRQTRHIHIFLLLLFVCCITSCSNHREREALDNAESLLESRPDSAFTILKTVDKSSLSSKADQARYALLMSIALDKNYIDTTNFDVLQPAIDYYLKKGTPDEKLRTYYYQGRIYQNNGDDDSAMRAFINATDLREEVSDSLLLAHLLVAQATYYFKQSKIEECISNHLDAAKIYGNVGKDLYETKSYACALNGYMMLDNKPAVDSLMSIVIPLAQRNHDCEVYLVSSALSYIVEYGTPEEIKSYLHDHQNIVLTKDIAYNISMAYSKIGEHEKALDLISKINIEGSIMDSLRYATVKTELLKAQGDYKQAFAQYREFSIMWERYQKELLSQDLLFAEKRHQLEIANLREIQNREHIIVGIICGAIGLLFLAVGLYYRYRMVRSKRIIAEKENDNLRLEQEKLRKEKENAELEAANFFYEKKQLERERDNLKELFKEQMELTKPLQEVIKIRLDMLNSLLAKEIANNDNHAKPYKKWIESIQKDKTDFMNSTRLAFKASNPHFIQYLENHDLTDFEINYVCLYAIGLNGKEVGEYIQLKSHYNVSSEIRKKLNLGEHETNLSLYIRRLMEELGHEY